MDALSRPQGPKLVCLYGPESVGKTTIGRQLADHFQTQFVEEVARDMVFDSQFTAADIVRIGHAQTKAVAVARQNAIQSGNKLLLCDTDVITTQLYSQIYLNEVPPILYELEKQVHYDRYFLFNIDVPWVADGLRDLGHRRQEVFDRFRLALIERQIPYTLVSGGWPTRWKTVREEIERMLKDA